MKSPKQKIYFDNAPIKEAVCSFSFKNALNKEITDNVVVKLKETYPQNNPFEYISFVIGEKSEVTKGIGTLITSKDGLNSIRVQPNTISIHQLGKYNRWSEFSDKAKSVLEILSKDIILGINSITLKKINSFFFDTNENINKYFNCFVNINEDYFFEEDKLTVNHTKNIDSNTQLLAKVNVKNIGVQKNVIMEVSYRTHSFKPSSLDEILLQSKNGNELLYDCFWSLITDELFQRIK